MSTGPTLGELWSRGARDWASYVEPQYPILYEAIYDLLGIGNGTRLLDVGCGPGGAALLAAGHGARVAGLDASPDSIGAARERIPSGDFRVGDMKSLPWPDGTFDVVTGFNSFQFEPAAALAEASRVLASGRQVGNGDLFATGRERADRDHGRDRCFGASAGTKWAKSICPLCARCRGVCPGDGGPATGRSRRGADYVGLPHGGNRM